MCFTPVEPPTAKAAELVGWIKLVILIQIIVCGIKFFWPDMQDTANLTELLGCFALYVSYALMRYCGCVLYSFLCLISLFQIGLKIGQVLQDHFVQGKLLPIPLLVISGGICIFYVFALTIAFLSYREFKAIEMDGFSVGDYSNFGGGVSNSNYNGREVKL